MHNYHNPYAETDLSANYRQDEPNQGGNNDFKLFQ